MEDRLITRFIKDTCERQAVAVQFLSGEWVIEMRKNGVLRRIVGSNLDYNDQAAAALARDKVAMSAVLRAAGIAHIEHQLIKSRHQTEPNYHLVKVALENHSAVVIKPLEGSGGNKLLKATSVGEVKQFIDKNNEPSWTMSQFHEIEAELRLVMLRGRIALIYEKTQPVQQNGVSLFNLSKGAVASQVPDIEDVVRQLAESTMKATGLQCAAVDIVREKGGTYKVLEVNAAFSLRHYAKTNPATYHEVAGFYDQLVTDMFAT